VKSPARNQNPARRIGDSKFRSIFMTPTSKDFLVRAR
jgi:hypothetical protein